jgi:hypothetical protein
MTLEIGGTVRIDVRRLDGHAIAALSGPLNVSTMRHLGRELLQLLAAGQSVLVDLSRLELGWPPAVGVFPMALQTAGGWPAARLVLFGADARMTARMQAVHLPERVPLASHRRAAQALADTRPDLVDRYVNLMDVPQSERAARSAVLAACHDWRIPYLAEDLATITTELVINAVEHAASAPRLCIRLHGGEVTVGVRDDLPGTAPRPQLSCVGSPCGRGLLMVTALSSRWGVTPHDDGKTVWASLATTEPTARPAAGGQR